MTDNKKISEDILQHKKDAEKALIGIQTMECNIFGGNQNWSQVVKRREDHINDFIKSLEKQEQEFEHFK